jgi:hypothetical protein
VVRDENGTGHFDGSFGNARDVEPALAALVDAESDQLSGAHSVPRRRREEPKARYANGRVHEATRHDLDAETSQRILRRDGPIKQLAVHVPQLLEQDES